MTLRLTASTDGIAEAARLLRAGGLVAFPTETVYGLGADATDSAASARIYAAKGRPSFNPLIAHVAETDAALREGVFNPDALALARAFWPGPLTLVVPVKAGGTVSELSRAGLGSVGLRVPSHPVARALLAAVVRPVAAPSANRSGHVSPTSAAHVISDLDGRVDAILDGGSSEVGLESTIVACEDNRTVLLRPGSITREAIAEVIGRLPELTDDSDHAAPRSPGRMLAHYAPKTPIRWYDGRRIFPTDALLTFGSQAVDGADDTKAVQNLSPSGNLVEAAANLYSSLRMLDQAGASTIVVAHIPRNGLGEAIHDRLTRAIAAAGVGE